MKSSQSDLRCVVCSGDVIADTDGTALVCTACGVQYSFVLGVPFVGNYETEDILGLIEISANTNNRGNFGVNPAAVEGWEELLAAYHEASDKEAFIASRAEAQSPFLLNRYAEWIEVTHLAGNIELDGKDVLDIGAGLGFDSHRLSMRGASVTALEFSPLLAEAGQINFPHIRWIGGFSHILPFKNGSFDAVFCNAALHHMRDIPAAISEALRVLRPGGRLITTCDSFRPNNSGDDAELDIFAAEPAVLLGVNEGVPRFSDFTDALQLNPTQLDIDLYTHTLHNAPSGGTLTDLAKWDFAKDCAMLAQRSGSLALRVRLKSPWPEAARTQAEGVLSPAQYAEWLTSESSAISSLAQLMPQDCLDLPFPGERGSKFELLNGWRPALPFQYSRTAYRRGRWFLHRPTNADALLFELGLPKVAGLSDGHVEILLNGSIVVEQKLAPGKWDRVFVDLSQLPMAEVFTLEIHKRDGDESLDGAAFIVRDRRFITAQSTDAANTIELSTDSMPTVFVVIPVFNRLHYTVECIKYLQAQSYTELKIIVADGGSTDGTIEKVRADFPKVTVLTTSTELWWAGSMAMGIEHALQESNDESDCLLMMNNDTEIPVDFVATLVAVSQRFDAAVGALIVDSRDTAKVLDAGEFVEWSPYSFPVKSEVDPAEQFFDDVDVLPGRGSLVPLRFIRSAGNVDAKRFPHYLADYEFFYRLKRYGIRLGVSYETHVAAHIEETGIVGGSGVTSFAAVWRELFSRRSMGNVIDHWRFVSLHAPDSRRMAVRLRLLARIPFHLLLRTPLRPIGRILLLSVRAVGFVRGQYRAIRYFIAEARQRRRDVFCHPSLMPVMIRPFLYLLASPGPVNADDCRKAGVQTNVLTASSELRPLETEGWFAFSTIRVQSESMRQLLRIAKNPWSKIMRTFQFRNQCRHARRSME